MKKKELQKAKRKWYGICPKTEADGIGPASDAILEKAADLGLEVYCRESSNSRLFACYCSTADRQRISDTLGDSYLLVELGSIASAPFDAIKKERENENARSAAENKGSESPANAGDAAVLEMFGLSYEQSLLMFSCQKMLTQYDISITKSEKSAAAKSEWLGEWETGITDYLNGINGGGNARLIPAEELSERMSKEVEAGDNRTWYYIVVLELIEFAAYTPLGGENDKQYAKCKYDEKKTYEYIKEFIVKQGYLSEDKVDRMDKCYCKSIDHLSGKAGKIVTKVAVIVAVAALAAAVAAVAAGGIAVALFGGAFEGLSGAALTNACLALAGGGAIAAGGSGIVGGVAAIAGGGALLGLAGGGAVVGAGEMLLSTPEYTLTQAAKLETILKEVILNAQQDVVSAQKIIRSYQEQIVELNNQLTRMELENEKTKKEMKNVLQSLKYLKKSYKEMSAFASAYEVGLETEA